MINQTKYIVQGALLALLVIAVIKLAPYFISSKLTATKESTINHPALPTVHVIKNKEGQTLFSQNCSVCHSMIKSDDLLSITRVENQLKDSVLLHEWIHNSSKVLRSGNPYFNALVKEDGGVMMPDFPNLSDHQINAIINYMREAEMYH